MTWSLLIRNGSLIDGTGAPARRADVAVEGDRVVAVGSGLQGEARRVIDAGGHVVAPGFIDAHAHSDLFYFDCPGVVEAPARVHDRGRRHVLVLPGTGESSQPRRGPRMGRWHRRAPRYPVGDLRPVSRPAARRDAVRQRRPL